MRSIANLRATFGSFRRQSGSFPLCRWSDISVKLCGYFSVSCPRTKGEGERDGWMDRGNSGDGSDTASSWMLEPPPRRAAATMILPVPSPPLPLRLPPSSVGDFCQILGSERAALFSAVAAAQFNFFLLLGRGCCDDFAPSRSLVPLSDRPSRSPLLFHCLQNDFEVVRVVGCSLPPPEHLGGKLTPTAEEGRRGTISTLRVPLCPG